MATALSAYSIRIRVRLRNRPGVLGHLATALGDAGGSLMNIEIVHHDSASVTRDLVVFCPSEGSMVTVAGAAGRVADVEIVEVEDRTFALHEGGKLSIAGKSPVANRDDLAMAYTPGVARVCLAIAQSPALAHRYTMKSNTVAVVTDGTAVLGLGDIGPEAAMPVMEGKAALFKEFAGIDAVPLCLRVAGIDELVETVASLEPSFGGINLEDIASPRCFEIERRLNQRMQIPVFHDDQHGTAVVVLAALRNAAAVTGRAPEDLRVVLAGVGAAGVAIIKMLLATGITDIVAVDRKGAIFDGMEGLDDSKQWVAEHTNPNRRSGELAGVIRGADTFIGVSAPGILHREDVEAMAPRPIVFALANPIPEILPDEAEEVAAVMATGRSDYPNQINNVLAFPGIFRGALDAAASTITERMKVAAANAIAAVIPFDRLSPDEVVPSVFDRSVAPAVAAAVADAARLDGVARR
jgi:malate dehydrogenase (oxaloacetate-decarboxylating)